MRPLLAIIIWLTLIGGLYSYMNARENVEPQQQAVIQKVSDKYTLVVTTTFDTEPDHFKLKTDTDPDASILIRLNGLEIFRLVQALKGGDRVVVDNINSMHVGVNEFLLEVSPSLDAHKMPGAIRAQLFRSDQELVDKTFWTESGEKIISNFKVEIGPDTSDGDKREH